MSVKVRTRRVTTYTITDNDREFEVEHQPHDGYSTTVIVKDLPDGRVIVGYLSHDDDPPDPFDGDGMGKIYDRRNMSREDRNELRSAMGWDEYDTRIPGTKQNPYAVALDVYSHSGDSWSLAGMGMQCQWDTSHNAGVWIPDPCCVEHIEYEARIRLLPEGCKVSYERRGEEINVITLTMPDGSKHGGYKSFVTAVRAASRRLGVKLDKSMYLQKAREVARECAQQAVDEYNKYISGDAYGVCVEIFSPVDENREEFENDGDGEACWGFLGSDYAEQELKDSVECTFKHESEKPPAPADPQGLLFEI